ncbi:MAG: hypothetical protein ACMUJM_23425 [bacterium]
MKKLCNFYIKHILSIGALMCIIPVLFSALYIYLTLPLRQVYIFRLILSLIFGGLAGAYSNSYAVTNWLLRVTKKEYVKGVLNGGVGGLFAGIGTAAIPPLTGLIYSNHIEEAKTIIIATWIFGAMAGILVGSTLGFIGTKYLLEE